MGYPLILYFHTLLAFPPAYSITIAASGDANGIYLAARKPENAFSMYDYFKYDSLARKSTFLKRNSQQDDLTFFNASLHLSITITKKARALHATSG